MNIDEMQLQLVEDIASFVSYWVAMSKLDPANYPAEMDEQVWYEQFLTYLSVGEENQQ